MDQKDPVVIVSAKRTPIGAINGLLKPLRCAELGAHAIKSVLENSKIAADKIDQVIMGCVLGAGIGQAPARQAALGAGLPKKVAACTVNKVCGSGLQAVMLAHDQIFSGSGEVFVAGGMESMTNAPYLLLKAREGYRYGHGELIDHVVRDGLEDAYSPGCAMGLLAESAAAKYNLARDQQDEFAKESFLRARKAGEQGKFKEEIAAITLVNPKTKEQTVVEQDEAPYKPNLERIPTLKAVFKEGGTITAGNASSNADGAAAVLMMRASKAQELSLRPIAKIVGHASHSQEPEWFSVAPIDAIRKLMNKVNWEYNSVDLFEINEAFAVSTMAAIQELKLSNGKVNINGGACALGHPIGASGARVLVTLIHALRQVRGKRGVASLCIGGGEAVALAIEVL